MSEQPGRSGRRAALSTLITRQLEREMTHDDQKAALALLLGEAIQQLANVDRIADALERIADAVEAADADQS